MEVSNQSTTKNQPTEPKLTLKPARLDFLSTQTQVVFTGAIALFVVLIAWAPSLQCGFLLDDFLHLNYISRAFHGDWNDFLGNFYSNWAGSDIMRSYRPLVSLSIFTDFLFWKANPWGYHLTNLLLLFGCSFFTGLITLELTGIMGNRLRGVAAIWAALLFALYPLQAESTSWIIGRVDLLCTLFYLASVFCYLRFRLIREKKYFVLSLASFVAAILSKEMAYTLPAVITAAALILKEHSIISAPDEYKKKLKIQAQTAVLTFWFVSGMGLMSRFVFLGTLIGGYGDGGTGGSAAIGSAFSSLRNFLNVETLKQILFPINLDLIARAGAYDAANTITKILSAAYTGILALGVVRLAMNCLSKRVIAFLVIWTVVSVLPAFQIWHISPNMVGSRLFFLGSAPAIMLLVLLALPAIDAMKPALAKVFATLGGILLFVVLSVWTVCLQLNQLSWVQASHEVKTFIDSVAKAIAATPENRKIVLLNLPTDYSGAGMITRPQYLAYALSAPYFPNSNLTSRVITIEPPVGGSHDFVWPNNLKRAINEYGARAFKWNEAKGFPSSSKALLGLIPSKNDGSSSEGTLSSWTSSTTSSQQPAAEDPRLTAEPETSSNSTTTKESQQTKVSTTAQVSTPTQNSKIVIGSPSISIEIPYTKFSYVPDTSAAWVEKEPVRIEPVKRAQWTVVQNGGQRFEEIPDGLVITPGTNSGITLIAELPNFAPLDYGVGTISYACMAGTCPDIGIAWRIHDNDTVKQGSTTASIAQAKSSEDKTKDSTHERYSTNTTWLGRLRSWSLEKNIDRIALSFPPGNYSILLKGLQLSSDSTMSPAVSLNEQTREFIYDASKIPGSASVRVIGLAPHKTFDIIGAGELANALSSQSGNAIIDKTLTNKSGAIRCEHLVPEKNGSSYIRVQALDAQNHPIGFPSEPILIERSSLAERRR